jgi:hypothetical protein
MMGGVRGMIAAIFVFSAAACGGDDLKAQGETCFASSECAAGLTCDFGVSPAVCAPNQTNNPPDASVDPPVDAEPPLPDGDPGAVSLAVTPTPNQDCGIDPAGLLAGQGSACATYTVTNTGGLTSGALGVALSDVVNFEILADTCSGNSFATDETCTVEIGHRPQDVALNHDATLTVSEASVADVTRTLNGIGISALSSAPESAAFPDTTVGQSSAGIVLTITNAANTPATGTLAVTLGGTNPGEFSVVSDCDAATVAAGATCTATVTFSPTVAAAAEATADITDGTANKTVSIPLSGTGI